MWMWKLERCGGGGRRVLRLGVSAGYLIDILLLSAWYPIVTALSDSRRSETVYIYMQALCTPSVTRTLLSLVGTAFNGFRDERDAWANARLAKYLIYVYKTIVFARIIVTRNFSLFAYKVMPLRNMPPIVCYLICGKLKGARLRGNMQASL